MKEKRMRLSQIFKIRTFVLQVLICLIGAGYYLFATSKDPEVLFVIIVLLVTYLVFSSLYFTKVFSIIEIFENSVLIQMNCFRVARDQIMGYKMLLSLSDEKMIICLNEIKRTVRILNPVKNKFDTYSFINTPDEKIREKLEEIIRKKEEDLIFVCNVKIPKTYKVVEKLFCYK